MKPENHLICPVIRMELTFDDNKMQFYPTYNTIRDLFLSVVDKIAQALPSVQSIKGFINAENEIIDTTVSNDSIKKAGERLKESLEFYMIEPRSHLSAYIEKYSFIVDGTAEKRIDAFIADHTKEFDDYTVEIQSFQDIITQIQRELSVVEFDMILLMCDDLKIALIRITREHMNRLIEVLIRNHRLESHKICEEYEHIKGKNNNVLFTETLIFNNIIVFYHGASENKFFDSELFIKKKWKIYHLIPKTQKKVCFYL